MEPELKTDVSTVLVRRRAAIGDVIMATGVIREIKQHSYGIQSTGVNITVATDYPEVFKNNPYVDQIVGMDVDPRAFDFAIDLDDAYEVTPTLNLVDCYFQKAFGASKDVPKWPELYMSQEDTVRPRQLIEKIKSEYIVIHMRNWHWAMKNVDSQIWLQILLGLFSNRDDLAVVFVGGATDHCYDLPQTYDARGFSLHENCELIQKARLFIGGDSAPFHVAACTDTPILALLTHLLPLQIMPYRRTDNMDNAIMSSMPCVGCYGRQPVPVRYVRCEYGDYRCNRTWDVDKIVKTMLEMLA
jgi:ADP-heptose:LPS heptosyltransferase